MRDHQRTGIACALAGFVLLSIGDAVIKSMAGQWAPTAIATLRYLLGAIGMSALLYAREGRAGFAVPRAGLQLVRGAAVAVATVSFFSALIVMPLAEATTIVFASPVITALLAPLVLGERAGARVWGASVLAFAGVLIVLRPNVAALGPAALLPLISALAMSVLVMANRAGAGTAGPLAMQVMMAACALPFLFAVTMAGELTGIAALDVHWPPLIVLAKTAFVAVSASTGHWLIFLATTRTGAATIAPVTYIQLLVASGLGWLWFGDRPDAATGVGAGVIIAAGLWLWHGRSEIAPPGRERLDTIS